VTLTTFGHIELQKKIYRPNTSRIFFGYLNIFLFQGKFNMTKKTIFLSQLSIFLSWIAKYIKHRSNMQPMKTQAENAK
jgi:hypothetical protein